MEFKLSDLAGYHVFSGIEIGYEDRNLYGYEEPCNFVRFCIDGQTFQLDENPSDGYRSYAENLHITDKHCRYHLPDVKVVCSHKTSIGYESCDILTFIDIKNGKEILSIGTERLGDYYPCCIFEYTPENISQCYDTFDI